MKFECIILLPALFVAGSCARPASSAQSAPAHGQESASAGLSIERETLVRLRRFQASTLRDSITDEASLSLLDELNRATVDDRLPDVELFAVSEEGRPIAWPLARLLIDRRRLDAAANVIVTTLLHDPDPGHREYHLCKWWEYSFSARASYREMNIEFADALLNQFASGTIERRRVVAELFGKGADEARLSPEAFRHLIETAKE